MGRRRKGLRGHVSKPSSQEAEEDLFDVTKLARAPGGIFDISEQIKDSGYLTLDKQRCGPGSWGEFAETFFTRTAHVGWQIDPGILEREYFMEEGQGVRQGQGVVPAPGGRVRPLDDHMIDAIRHAQAAIARRTELELVNFVLGPRTAMEMERNRLDLERIRYTPTFMFAQNDRPVEPPRDIGGYRAAMVLLDELAPNIGVPRRQGESDKDFRERTLRASRFTWPITAEPREDRQR